MNNTTRTYGHSTVNSGTGSCPLNEYLEEHTVDFGPPRPTDEQPITRIGQRDVYMCGNCGHFRYSDTNAHVSDYVITRTCDQMQCEKQPAA